MSAMDFPTDSDRQRAKSVLSAIILRAGGEFAGKTRLNKAFYYAHLWYFENYPGTLTEWPIFRGPYGPAIHKGDELLDELVADGMLAVGERSVGNCVERYYKLLTPDEIGVPDAIARAADYGVAKVGDRSATAVSQETHEKSREWKRSPMGAELNIYADLLSDDEYRAAHRAQADVAALLADILD